MNSDNNYAVRNNCRMQINNHLDKYNVTGFPRSLVLATLDDFETDEQSEVYTANILSKTPTSVINNSTDNDVYSEDVFRTMTSTPDIVNGIIKTGTVSMFVGASKSYKTWHLARLGLCISQGLPWFNFTTRKSKVLMINPELIANEFQIRIKYLAENLGIPLENINGNFNSWSLRRKKMDPDNLVEEIKQKIINEKIEVVLLDSLYRLYGARTDENNNADMMRLMLKLEDLCCLDGVTAIFSHHTSKGSQEGKRIIDIAGGAGALGRFVDTAIVTKAIDDQDDLHRFGLSIIYRYGKAPGPIGLIMDGPNATIDPHFNKRELNVNNKYNSGTILNLLKEGPVTYTELYEKVNERTGIAESTFKLYWKDIKTIPGVVNRDGNWSYNINEVK